MKTTFLSIILCIPFLGAIAQQDTIPNPGFEQWGTNPFYDEPIGWTTLNPLASILGSELAFKADGAGEFHSGAASIKLVTTNIAGIGVAPSILTNGSINTTTQNVEGGSDFASRPISLGGWFRFDPVNTDTGFVNITLTKWNEQNGITDIVGVGASVISNTNGSFVNLEATIEYASTEVPDTVLILFGSGTDASPQEGTALYVDDIYYTYPAGMVDQEEIEFSIFPNPATDVLNVSSLEGHQFTSASVYALDGRLMNTTKLDLNTQKVDVSTLRPNTYILELVTEDNTVVRRSFLKN